MKKLFTILALCFAVFAAKAQVTVTLETHNVWGDGSGYQLLLDANATAFGTIIPESGGLTSSGNASAATYAEFEYKIPANADGNLNTQNVVVDGSVTITIPAGTYDFCVANPTPGDRVWIASSQTPYGRYDNFVFRDGWSYHFTVTLSGSNDYVALDSFRLPTEPTIMVSPATVDFGYTLLDEPAVRTASVMGFLFNDSITATVAGSKFSVSLDTTFSSSVRMPAAGGTLYVKYAPTAVETNNDTIFLTCNDTSAMIILTGEGFECGTVASFPYEIDFTNAVLNSCWSILDANHDSSTFVLSATDGLAYYMYNSDNSANDWLISPVFTLTGHEYAAIDYAAYSSSYPEKFEVYVIHGQDTTIVMDEMTVATSTIATQVVDLRDYTGDCQVAIRCTSDSDQYAFIVNKFVLSDEVVFETSIDSIDYSLVVVGNNATQTIELSRILVSDSVVVTTVAPFSISLDGADTTFATRIVLPADTMISSLTNIYVRYTPTEDVVSEEVVVFTAGTLTDTVSLRGEGFECHTIATFPYLTNFTNDTTNLCWTIEDANNDGRTFAFSTANAFAYYTYSSTNAANDWLTSPVFMLTGNEYATFKYSSYSASYPEKFEVYVINGDTSIRVVEETTVASATYHSLLPIDLSSFTGETQIAIHCTSAADQWRLMITDFLVDSIANLEAALMVDPTSINFGSLVYTEGVSATETATVSTIVVYDTLMVTTAAPFSVSLNDSVYTDSLIIRPVGLSFSTTLYVKYAPTAAGTHTGTVVIADSALTATINLSGSVEDCNEAVALPFVEDFEDEISACWSNIDNDGDGNYWMQLVGEDYADYAHGGSGFFTSASYTSGGALTPDNWLITPKIAIPAEGACLEFWVGPQDPDWPEEHYQVMVSTTGNSVSDFSTVLVEETLSQSVWVRRTVNLEYPSQNVYVAFVHNESSDVFRINLDDINITAGLSGVEESEISAVSIYPNPASTVLNVHAENYDNVQIVNFLGQVVYSANVTDNDFQINVSNLSNGVYFIRLNGETTTTQKFIKR